jgi:hypothetical protein
VGIGTEEQGAHCLEGGGTVEETARKVECERVRDGQEEEDGTGGSQGGRRSTQAPTGVSDMAR